MANKLQEKFANQTRSFVNQAFLIIKNKSLEFLPYKKQVVQPNNKGYFFDHYKSFIKTSQSEKGLCCQNFLIFSFK